MKEFKAYLWKDKPVTKEVFEKKAGMSAEEFFEGHKRIVYRPKITSKIIALLLGLENEKEA